MPEMGKPLAMLEGPSATPTSNFRIFEIANLEVTLLCLRSNHGLNDAYLGAIGHHRKR